MKHVQQPAPADDADGEKRESDPAGEPAEFLERLDGADGLFHRRSRERAHLGESGHHARHLLNSAEGRAVRARHHHRRDDRRPAEPGIEELGEARALERAGPLLFLPCRRLWEKRPDDDQGNGWNHAGHQRVPPRFVSAAHQRKVFSVRRDHVVGASDHEAAQRSQRLRVSDHRLTLFRVREELREPRDRRDELDAHAHERAAAPEQQPLHRRRVAGGERRERVEQDAPHEHTAASEQVGEVAAEQAEDPACDRRHIKEDADPVVDGRVARWHAQQRLERRAHDERQHQQHVRVEGEADGGDDADQPLQRCETGLCGVGCHVASSRA